MRLNELADFLNRDQFLVVPGVIPRIAIEITQEVTYDNMKTLIITTTTPYASIPSWFSAETPPPKNSPSGSEGGTKLPFWNVRLANPDTKAF